MPDGGPQPAAAAHRPRAEAAHPAGAPPARVGAVRAAHPRLRRAAVGADRQRADGVPARGRAPARRGGRAEAHPSAPRRAEPGARPAADGAGPGDGALGGQAAALARRPHRRRGGPREPGRHAPARRSGWTPPAPGPAFPRCASRSSSRWRAARASARTVDAAAVIRAWTRGWGSCRWRAEAGRRCRGRGWTSTAQRVADLLAARQDGRPGRQPRPAGAGRAVRDAGAAASAGARPAGAAGRGLREAARRRRCRRDLTATLRPYQQQGVSWLALPADSGAGRDPRGRHGPRQDAPDALRAGPGARSWSARRSVLPNWAAELAALPARRSRCASTTGPAARWTRRADVTLTTYAMLRLDAAALAGEPWDAVVLDEAQAIKNPDSQVARAAFALAASFRLALSGTPRGEPARGAVEPDALHQPGPARRARDVRGAHGAADRRRAAGRGRAAAPTIRPFVLRRLKRDVAPELPPRTESVLHVRAR